MHQQALADFSPQKYVWEHTDRDLFLVYDNILDEKRSMHHKAIAEKIDFSWDLKLESALLH